MKKEQMNTEKKCPTLGTFSLMESQEGVFWMVMLLVLLTQTQGYCVDTSISSDMDAMTNSVMNTIFSPWVKKTALCFGGGMGLFQAYGAGSVKPLLVWGGLGLAVNYIPKVAQMISGM